jgi:ABC-type transport system involved in cytochrome c biogenesis permease subunit
LTRPYRTLMMKMNTRWLSHWQSANIDPAHTSIMMLFIAGFMACSLVKDLVIRYLVVLCVNYWEATIDK